MEKNKQYIILAVVAIVVILLLVSVVNLISTPSKADYDEEIFEKIGGDEFLNVTLKHAHKLGEENIPDGSFKCDRWDIGYYDAKNITYVDSDGNKDYFVIWKTTPDKYSWVDTNNSVNQYISDYLIGGSSGKCFVEYSYEDNYVYGVVMSTENTQCSESDLIYDILGLNKDGFNLIYSGTSSTASSGSSSGSSGYHTVVPDRNTLAKTDPGSYYDHYEYGDNYEIDDYLESQGFD